MSASRCRPLVLAAALLLLAPAQAPAQRKARPPGRPFEEDTHAFRRILFDQNLQPLASLDEAAARPADTVLIVLGDLRPLTRVPGGLRAFLDRGGAVLIASDSTSNDDDVRRALHGVAGVVLPNGEGASVLNPWRCFRNFADCPLVDAAPGAAPDLFARKRHAVATNRPAWLVPTARVPGILALARFPLNTLHSIGGRRVFGDQPLFAVGGNLGRGRVLVLADHSVFINSMMIPKDNENVEMTQDAIHWLRDGRRTRALFVDDGYIHTDFSVKVKDTDLTDELLAVLGHILDQADELIAEVEEDDAINKGLLDVIGKTPRQLAGLGCVALTLALMFFGCVRLLGPARHRLEPGLPALGKTVAEHEPAAAPLAARQEALRRTGNLWEPARALARETFLACGHHPPPGAPAPRVTVTRGGWWQRRRVRRFVLGLWRLAFGAAPVPVRRPAWLRLPDELAELRALLSRGVVRLGPA
jgi:hypothetical protein